MQIEFLGTGGAVTTPRPGCTCRVCVQARERGIPYSRTGPSVFVRGPNVLIDTPEESKDQLNRAQIARINACFYSHWHPDHVMGRRVWEALNMDWVRWPPQPKRTDIYLPQQVAQDVRRMLGTWDHLAFLEQQGLVRLIELADGESVVLGATRIRPFRLAEQYVYAFLFEESGKRLLIAPDELRGWAPPEEVRGLDIAVLPMGISEFDPFTGERRIAEAHPMLRAEATFRETLEIVRQLGARRVVMTHIEEPDSLSYDDLHLLEEQLHRDGLNISFAFDTMRISV